MSSANQEFRAVLPRRVKKSFNYRVFDQLGMQSDALIGESEVGDELVHGATGGNDSMSKADFEDLKDRLSIYMDSEESDTDEETKELEIEKRMKELEELEELELKGASKPKKEKSVKKVEQSKKGKDKDSKGDELSNLNIKHLRKDTKTKKIVDKHMKQMLATESNSESDSSISSSSSSDSSTGSGSEPNFLSSSDSDSETTHKKKNKHKKKKVRSGIKDRPHDKVKIKMNWPQSELKYEFTNRKAVEFRQLTMSQFCAGELEIIRHCKISKKEREGRLSLLNKICYYASEFEWSVLLNFYAAWVKLIEKGENVWSDDTSLLEVRMLIGKKVLNKTASKYSDKSSEKNFDRKVWYCPLYQRNKCNISKDGHNLDIAGKSRFVQHICATCLREDKAKMKHPESSSACPHMP
ncbi:unnamed protein product [Mytilus edulis]|uniref:Uncharacterized protein n=1 Tax=Mytilus edulis TaxID=6550 RepID=A0A8S3ST68_MYTED|nr:unnamed protein product [Mytilus edulis]